MDGDEPVIAPDGRGLPAWWRRHLWWVDPRTWGIPVRSAIAAAAVVLVSFVIVGAAVAAVLYRQLLADVDSTADQRAREVVAALQSGPLDELDGRLLATNGQIVAVQILDASGAVVRATPGSPAAPTTGPGAISRPSVASTSAEGDEDVRVREQSTDDSEGGYTVVVKSANGAVRSTVRNVALLLAAAMPFVVGGAAAANFVLARRSLRSVEAIRAQAADISAQDLFGRVPVPAHRGEISALASTMNDMLARVESGGPVGTRGQLLPLYAAGFVTAFGAHSIAASLGGYTHGQHASLLALGLLLAVYDGAEVALKVVSSEKHD